VGKDYRVWVRTVGYGIGLPRGAGGAGGRAQTVLGMAAGNMWKKMRGIARDG